MKNADKTVYVKSIISYFLIVIFTIFSVHAQDGYAEYSGKVVDSESGKGLVFATLEVSNSNISTITNNDGEFLLKVPDGIKDQNLVVSFLGYKQLTIALSSLKNGKNTIKLFAQITELPETNINIYKDARELVKEVFRRKAVNNLDERVLMTAFYRETIKKRRKNVSLAEAIVNVHKQPYSSFRKDDIQLYKSRKSTDYSKLDTVALKLQGGPFNALYVDMMKYPKYIFTNDMMEFYKFTYAPSTTINGKVVYVVNFSQREAVSQPLYYGKLFIDAETLALNSAIYNLNVEDKELASGMFVKRKPRGVKVFPTRAAYRVDYREKNGKWYYSYSNVQMTFKVNRKRKLFNSVYSLSSEMAVTDWKINDMKENLKSKEKIRPSIIIADETSGFSDPQFWGAYNVIEPEKSIESAINKIKRQLKKTG